METQSMNRQIATVIVAVVMTAAALGVIWALYWQVFQYTLLS